MSGAANPSKDFWAFMKSYKKPAPDKNPLSENAPPAIPDAPPKPAQAAPPSSQIDYPTKPAPKPAVKAAPSPAAAAAKAKKTGPQPLPLPPKPRPQEPIVLGVETKTPPPVSKRNVALPPKPAPLPVDSDDESEEEAEETRPKDKGPLDLMVVEKEEKKPETALSSTVAAAAAPVSELREDDGDELRVKFFLKKTPSPKENSPAKDIVFDGVLDGLGFHEGDRDRIRLVFKKHEPAPATSGDWLSEYSDQKFLFRNEAEKNVFTSERQLAESEFTYEVILPRVDEEGQASPIFSQFEYALDHNGEIEGGKMDFAIVAPFSDKYLVMIVSQ